MLLTTDGTRQMLEQEEKKRKDCPPFLNLSPNLLGERGGPSLGGGPFFCFSVR